MTAPLHSREIKGRGRYYGPCSETCPLGSDTGELYISVTNAQSVINKPALPPAAARDTAQAAWDRLPQMVATSRQPLVGIPVDGNPKTCDRRSPVSTRCGGCRFCLNMVIKAQYKEQWETKAELGTRVHNRAHAHVLGQPALPDEEVEPFFGQYLEFLERWKVDLDQHVVAAETTVFDRKHRYAGTGDVWLQLPTGPAGRRQLWLIDIKTSLTKPANVVYADQELQLAGLRFAPTAVLVDDTEIKVPTFAGAALLNLRQEAHALIPLPAGKDAHRAFLAAVTLQSHFHGQDTKAWQPLDVPAASPKAVA